MKKIAILGNCQAPIIAEYLSIALEGLYEIIPTPPVYIATRSDVDILHAVLPKVDFFITQPITKAYRNNIGLGTEDLVDLLPSHARCITWPVVYWIGQTPEISYLRDSNKIAQFGLHHKLIFEGYKQNLPAPEVIENFNNYDSIPGDTLIELAQESLHELSAREKTLDIKVVPFIRDNFKEKRLFWTMNHPTPPLLRYIAQQILDLLNEPYHHLLPHLPDRLKHIISFPILPSVYHHLDLQFTEESTACVNSKNMFFPEAVMRYYSFYRKNKEALKFNLSY